MAGKVRFYRGAKGTSLPATHQNGAIFIIERDDVANLGDMYVDMDNGKRLHIIPDSELITYNSSMSGTTSTRGQVYVFQEDNKKGIAVGDGTSYIGDLPVYNAIVREAVKSKVNAYLGTEYLSLNKDLTKDKNPDTNVTLSSGITDAAETLVLSRELWLEF